MHAQLVTVPILDARMQELRAETRISLMAIESKLDAKVQELRSEIRQSRAELEVKMEGIKAELVRWVFLSMLGNVALSAGVAAILKYLG